MPIAHLLPYFSVIMGGFLCGSIMFCRIIPLKLRGIDICALSSDGNPGTSNVFILCGRKMGFLCLFFELLKGFLPIFAAINIIDVKTLFFSLAMLAPVLGHALAIFSPCKGGKCIAVIFGEMIALFFISPVGLILCLLYILFSTVLKIPSRRIRSIITFTLFALFSSAFLIYSHLPTVAVGCTEISLISIYKHLCDKSELKEVLQEKSSTERAR